MSLSAEPYNPTPLSDEEQRNLALRREMILDLGREMDEGLPYAVRHFHMDYAQTEGVVLNDEGEQIRKGWGTMLWTRRKIGSAHSPVELVAQPVRVKKGKVIEKIGQVLVHCRVDREGLDPGQNEYLEFSTVQSIEFLQEVAATVRLIHGAAKSAEKIAA